jgi:hypothetical protein
MRFRSSGLRLWAAALAMVFLPLVFAPAQQVHHNGFESVNTAWVKGGADAAFDELAHQMTDQGAHDGKRSEYLRINARQGTYINYQYTTGKAPISAELNASVWVKANRPGIQLLARIVLPNERDPNHLEGHLTAVLRADVYRLTGRWQRLELSRPVQLAKQQQQLMQAQLRRPLNFQDAYVEALLLNIYGGPGPTEVWIDDLEIGPLLPDNNARPAIRQGTKVPVQPAILPRAPRRTQVIDFNGTQLLEEGKPFFFRGIRHTDTPLKALRSAGFNTVWLNYTDDPKLFKEAADLGFWVVPAFQVLDNDARLADADGIRREMARFTDNDSLLFWYLGGTLDFEQTSPVAQAVQFMKTIDPSRPLAADVWAGLSAYSRSLQLLGIHRFPLMTTLELPMYRDWLNQKREVAPDTFFWTWVQTHMPDWYSYLLYNQPGNTAFKEPVGPQPEQIRLLTYMALGAGCRGLAFWSDRFLADSHFGRDRLLCLALINLELDMLEPLLFSTERAEWIGTSSPDVQAAVLRSPRGILVLPIWQGKGAQFVPGQSAVSNLTLTVPQVPQSHQAWEVTPADVRGLRSTRVVGGTKVTVQEFGLTTAIVFTSDFAGENSIVGRFQSMAASRRQLAAQWSYDMALYEMEKVLRVERQLEKQGQTVSEAPRLIEDAETRLKNARKFWEARLFSDTYHESERALRPLRILMRAQWENAVKPLDTPVASPYAVSFFTLPRHREFLDEVRRGTPAANVLPGGDFEILADRGQDAWRPEQPTIDAVELSATTVSIIPLPPKAKAKTAEEKKTTDEKKTTGKEVNDDKKAAETEPTFDLPRRGRQCLKLEIKPKPGQFPPRVLERTLLALNSPVVHLQPGTLVMISGWICIPAPIGGTVDGALFYDSVGGEPLAVRLTEATKWKRFVLYRRVPDSGAIHITLALTGLGAAYFDDIRIEPLVAHDRVAGQ